MPIQSLALGSVQCVHETRPNFWTRVEGYWVYVHLVQLEPKGLEIGKVGFKPPPKEHQNKITMSKLGSW